MFRKLPDAGTDTVSVRINGREVRVRALLAASATPDQKTAADYGCPKGTGLRDEIAMLRVCLRRIVEWGAAIKDFSDAMTFMRTSRRGGEWLITSDGPPLRLRTRYIPSSTSSLSRSSNRSR